MIKFGFLKSIVDKAIQFSPRRLLSSDTTTTMPEPGQQDQNPERDRDRGVVGTQNILPNNGNSSSGNGVVTGISIHSGSGSLGGAGPSSTSFPPASTSTGGGPNHSPSSTTKQPQQTITNHSSSQGKASTLRNFPSVTSAKSAAQVGVKTTGVGAASISSGSQGTRMNVPPPMKGGGIGGPSPLAMTTTPSAGSASAAPPGGSGGGGANPGSEATASFVSQPPARINPAASLQESSRRALAPSTSAATSYRPTYPAVPAKHNAAVEGWKPAPAPTGNNNNNINNPSSISTDGKANNASERSNGQQIYSTNNKNINGNGMAQNVAPMMAQQRPAPSAAAGVAVGPAKASVATTTTATKMTAAQAQSQQQKLKDAATAELQQGNTMRAVQLLQQAGIAVPSGSQVGVPSAATATGGAPLLMTSPSISFSLQQQAAALVHAGEASNIEQALTMIQQRKKGNASRSNSTSHNKTTPSSGEGTGSMPVGTTNWRPAGKDRKSIGTNSDSRKRKVASLSAPPPQDRQSNHLPGSNNEAFVPQYEQNDKEKKAKLNQPPPSQFGSGSSSNQNVSDTPISSRGGFFINGQRAEKEGLKLTVNGFSKSARGRKRGSSSAAGSTGSLSSGGGSGRARTDHLQQQQQQQRSIHHSTNISGVARQSSSSQSPRPSSTNEEIICIDSDDDGGQSRRHDDTRNDAGTGKSSKKINGHHVRRRSSSSSRHEHSGGSRHEHSSSPRHEHGSSPRREHGSSLRQEHGSSSRQEQHTNSPSKRSSYNSSTSMASAGVSATNINTGATNMFLPPSPVAHPRTSDNVSQFSSTAAAGGGAPQQFPHREPQHPGRHALPPHRQQQHPYPHPHHRVPNQPIATMPMPPPPRPLPHPQHQQQQQQQQQHMHHLHRRRQQQQQQQLWLQQQAAMRNNMNFSGAQPSLPPQQQQQQPQQQQRGIPQQPLAGVRTTTSASAYSSNGSTADQQQQQRMRAMGQPDQRAQHAISFIKGIAKGEEKAFAFFDGGTEEAVKHATAKLLIAVTDAGIPIPTSADNNNDPSSTTTSSTNEQNQVTNSDLSPSSHNVTLSLAQLEQVARSSVLYHRQLTTKFIQRAYKEMQRYQNDVVRRLQYNDKARLHNLNIEFDKKIKDTTQRLERKAQAQIQKYKDRAASAMAAAAESKERQQEDDGKDVQQQPQVRTVTLEEQHVSDKSDKKEEADISTKSANGEASEPDTEEKKSSNRENDNPNATKDSPEMPANEQQVDTKMDIDKHLAHDSSTNAVDGKEKATEGSSAAASTPPAPATNMLEILRLKEEAAKEKADLLAQHRQTLEQMEANHKQLLTDATKMYKDENVALKQQLESLKRQASQMNQQYRVASTQAFRLWRKDPT